MFSICFAHVPFSLYFRNFIPHFQDCLKQWFLTTIFFLPKHPFFYHISECHSLFSKAQDQSVWIWLIFPPETIKFLIWTKSQNLTGWESQILDFLCFPKIHWLLSADLSMILLGWTICLYTIQWQWIRLNKKKDFWNLEYIFLNQFLAKDNFILYVTTILKCKIY